MQRWRLPPTTIPMAPTSESLGGFGDPSGFWGKPGMKTQGSGAWGWRRRRSRGC